MGGGAWKNFPALLDLYTRFPHARWVFFCDDDTYVFVSGLLTYLSRYQPSQPYYVGLYFTPRVDMEWREVQIAYASGGAGYALSHSLLHRLAPRMPACHANYTHWAGDLRVGKCVRDVGVHITPASGFHHEGHDKYVWDRSGAGYPYGHLTNRASAQVVSPITFHHLSVDTMAMYERMHAAEVRGAHGERFRYDFSRLYLKEYSASVLVSSVTGDNPSVGGGTSSVARPHSGVASVRVLFGVSVEVQMEAEDAKATPKAKGRAKGRGTNVLFSDPLYLRATPSADGAMGFEMVLAKVPEPYDGDGCDDAALVDPHRLPARLSAVVAVLCQPCVAAHAGGAARAEAAFDQICEVRRTDSCTLKVELSLRCPPRETLYAPMLDVQLHPGGRELVSAGVPVSCAAGQEARPQLLGASDAIYVALTHGSLRVTPPEISTSSNACSATVEGEGALAHGGVLAAVDGPQRLRVRCSCAARTLVTNLTLTLRLLDYSSPVVTLARACSPDRDQSGVN